MPGHIAQGHYVKGLAVGRQMLVEGKAPAMATKAARLHHKGLAFVFQRYTHRAGVGRHGPFVPGHYGVQIHAQGKAGGVGGQHQLVAAAGQIGAGQGRALPLTRLGFSGLQTAVRPWDATVPALHA